VKKTQGRHGSGHPWTFATRAAGRTVGERREEKRERERCSRCPNSSRIGRRSSRVQTMQVSGGGALCSHMWGGYMFKVMQCGNVRNPSQARYLKISSPSEKYEQGLKLDPWLTSEQTYARHN
jgi:hypothetical protein